MKKLIIISVAILIIACNDSPKKAIVDSKNTDKTIALVANNNQGMATGFKLLENSCFSCHSPNKNMPNNIAPTLAEIKSSYMQGEMSLEDFQNHFIRFVQDPSIEHSNMPGAIEKYGLMPKMNLTEEELANIATYMYHTDIEAPQWYEQNYLAEKMKYDSLSSTNDNPIEQYKSMAMKTKSVLGKNLLNAINTKGTEHAVSFCSERAIHLTDSTSLSLNASIKRVSDKNRNPDNVANADELEYILSAKEALKNNQKIQPQLKKINGENIAYIPIVTNEMCLQCHGKPSEDITAQTLTKIHKLYPNDKALGYESGELRGIWVVKNGKM